MKDKIPLRVYGISQSQLQSGAFALILAQIDGPYRIPVIIGPAEAQSIAIAVEGIKPPRPMTHDLFDTFTHACGIELKKGVIYKFEDGIFSSEMTFSDGNNTVVLDARTSDAIAIAMRTEAPIYTTPEILAETGFIMQEEPSETADDDDDDDAELSSEEKPNRPEPNLSQPKSTRHPRLEAYTIEELERTIAKLVENEEYEEAARVQEILNKKRADQK
ncbi:MAG: bifunctional nuclease family protein [Muribaculaceae bacterium]|nr:bifunctional nuclease family protein [Muribaculaceae bacterium]